MIKSLQNKRRYAINKHFEIELKKEIKKTVKSKEKTSIYFNYLNIGFYLLVPIMGGLGVGVVVDKWLKIKPIGVLCFLSFGFLASLYNLYRLTKECQR